MPEALRGKTMPMTWAAVLGIVNFVVLVVPSVLWAGAVSARLVTMEQAWADHKKESVHRFEFEKLEASAVKQDEFRQFSARVLDALARVESKLDRSRQQ
jgi:hypothetical protein